MKKFLLRIVAVFFIGLMVSCGTKTVKIGAIIPETGNLSGLGTSIKSGLELAIEELNQNSSIKYELIVSDAPSNREVLSAYNSMRYKYDVKIFVTAGSTYSMALKPRVINNGELLFCVASLPDITAEGSYNIYKIGNSSVDESNAIVNYILNCENRGNVVMFYPNSEYGTPFYNTIRNAINSCVCIVYDEKEANVNNLVALAIKNNPDKIITIGESPIMGGIIKSLRGLGYQKEIVANTMFTNSNVITAAGDAAKGVIYVDYNFDNNTISTQNRNNWVKEKYNIDFSSISFLAYSIPYFLNINEANLSRLSGEKTLDNIELHDLSSNIRSYDTLLIANEYLYYINKNGDIKPSLKLRRYE